MHPGKVNPPGDKDLAHIIWVTDGSNPLYSRMGKTACSKRCLIREHGYTFRTGKGTTLRVLDLFQGQR